MAKIKHPKLPFIVTGGDQDYDVESFGVGISKAITLVSKTNRPDATFYVRDRSDVIRGHVERDSLGVIRIYRRPS